jgi:hypothetical protein
VLPAKPHGEEKLSQKEFPGEGERGKQRKWETRTNLINIETIQQ